jgi:DTW domain-containing protein YfiP
VSRRANAEHRCPRCRVHASVCLCALIPRLETRTRLVLVIHRKEDRKSTNTGRLGAESLVNSAVVVRGHRPPGDVEPPLDWGEGRLPLLLFPAEDAVPIGAFAASPRPISLIVPDGNWRQASKVRARVPGLAAVPCVSLPPGTPSTYRLRSEPNEGGLATLEAIARAFGVLEGAHIQAELERVFRAMVERTLWSRGSLETESVASGIPEGAMRHDPRSGLARG